MQNQNDLISRQKTINEWKEDFKKCVNSLDDIPWDDYKVIMQYIDNLPSAEPETCAYWDRESNFCTLHRPSAQPANSDKISYSVICEKFPNPHVYFNTYNEAEHWAKFNQPNYRPYYITKCSEHFETVGEVR